ncbi:LysM peptidoglycan-binding domain-containing protein, partial [Martelella alba]
MIVWINIAFQLLFPLCVVFSPAIAAAIGQQTITVSEPYVLGPGETPATLAEKYHISLDKLKKLNQFRTFSRPFEQLTVGDEIDIPAQITDYSATPAQLKNTAENNGLSLAPSAQTRYSGAMSSFTDNAAVGARAPRDMTSEQAGGMVRSTAAGKAAQTIQQWLGQFGTARVQLNVDDNFHLDGSALDVLLPLHEQPHELLFTQLGARRQDSRNTLNIGAGSRTWIGSWMLGMNAFFDYDITGENRRLGLGLEAWRDYLKLSANSYIRTSNWRDSRDFDDYRERPANGYDIRAEAYLPAYPQLGGELMFEQYRGSNVALFGKDNLQNDPYAITLGINYTPISLFTVGVNHRQGKGSANDTTFNLQMNYRLGASWQSQVDPDAVAATRTLAGSRYDLVNRNNTIVLQYQKQQVLELRLPEHVSGYESDQTTIVAQVTSKYGLDHIDWNTAAITAAGGSVSQASADTLVVTLPPYQRAATATNIYTLSAVAYDTRKNASNRASTRIEVLQSPAQIAAGDLTVTRNNALANGIASNEVRAVVTDSEGKPLADQVVAFTATNGAVVTTVIGTTGADGVATATLTNTTAGISTVTATLNGASSRSVDTTFTADATTAHIAQGNLTVTANNAAANGIAANAVRALVTDAQ